MAITETELVSIGDIMEKIADGGIVLRNYNRQPEGAVEMYDNPDVWAWQQVLMAEGYLERISADDRGNFGDVTEQATREFQQNLKDQGLYGWSVDGEVGEMMAGAYLQYLELYPNQNIDIKPDKIATAEEIDTYLARGYLLAVDEAVLIGGQPSPLEEPFVRGWQDILVERGYLDPAYATGGFGGITESATRLIFEAYGLDDGVEGGITVITHERFSAFLDRDAELLQRREEQGQIHDNLGPVHEGFLSFGNKVPEDLKVYAALEKPDSPESCRTIDDAMRAMNENGVQYGGHEAEIRKANDACLLGEAQKHVASR